MDAGATTIKFGKPVWITIMSKNSMEIKINKDKKNALLLLKAKFINLPSTRIAIIMNNPRKK